MIEHLNHVAIIPDGNRRWAKQHGLPLLEGHKRGSETMHTVVDYLIGRVKFLTVWGFSGDNWKRTVEEIRDLLHLLAFSIERDAPWLNSRGVKLRHIGRLHQLPDFLQLAMNQAIELTSDNTGMTLALAFSYSGRAEIVDAARRLVRDKLPFKINETVFSDYLYTSGMPDVDLVIRTAGEVRLSNFMLWQTAYSELFFSKSLWPDFGIEELEKALGAYSERRRRFGGD